MELLIALGVLVVLGFWIVSIYNQLVALKNRYENGFSQIEIQLKRRYDLIPNLVETAKGYMSHERETLESVIQARNQAMNGLQSAVDDPGNPQTIKELSSAEGLLGGALGRLNVVMESYPDLKANQNMMQLTEELTSTENKVAFARQGYNDQVTEYNSYRQSFPPVIFANLFKHGTDAELLEFADSEAIQAAPTVSFN